MAQDVKHLTMDWQGGLRFTGGRPGGPATVVDGDGQEAPSPMVMLLVAAAGCTGADVVLILQKMRIELTDFRMAVTGTRREEEPRRYVAIHFSYELHGAGLDETKARRAIDLSIEKYCSVLHSLASDLAITYDLRLA